MVGQSDHPLAHFVRATLRTVKKVVSIDNRQGVPAALRWVRRDRKTRPTTPADVIAFEPSASDNDLKAKGDALPVDKTLSKKPEGE